MTLRELLRRHHTTADGAAAPPSDPETTVAVPGAHGLLHIQEDGRVGIDLRDPDLAHTEVTCELACSLCGTTLDVSEVDRIGHMATLTCHDCGLVQRYRLPATMDLS
jgi:hypothetical protein